MWERPRTWPSSWAATLRATFGNDSGASAASRRMTRRKAQFVVWLALKHEQGHDEDYRENDPCSEPVEHGQVVLRAGVHAWGVRS